MMQLKFMKKMISYNVHSIQHLPDDWTNFGSLKLVNCFAFESYQGILKKRVNVWVWMLATSCIQSLSQKQKHRKNVKEKKIGIIGFSFKHQKRSVWFKQQYQTAYLKNGYLIDIASCSNSVISCNGNAFKVVSLFAEES